LFKSLEKRLSSLGLGLVLIVYYGCEYLTWSAQFAKNDIWSCAAFLIGVFSLNPWLQALGLGIAVGIKPTYVFGVATYLLILYFLNGRKLSQIWPKALSVAFFFGLMLLRNFLATGNPVFPQPSSMGFQTSAFRQTYYQRFSGHSDLADVAHKSLLLFRYVPGTICLLLALLASFSWLRKNKNSLMPQQKQALFMLCLPLPTLFLTGPELELRTFAGVIFAAFIYALIWLDGFELLRHKAIYYLLLLSFISTSKIDPSSFRRWWENKDKTFWQMNAKGEAYKRVNETLEDKDILLNLNYSEGFFLKPRMYTVDEHPAYEKITSQFPELLDVNNFIGVHTNGACFGTGLNENFVNKLLEKSSHDLTRDPQAEHLFYLNIEC
jgi:hypothetical protein